MDEELLGGSSRFYRERPTKFEIQNLAIPDVQYFFIRRIQLIAALAYHLNKHKTG